MAMLPEREEILVLTREVSGESGWLFRILTRQSGVLSAYKRVSNKRASQIPDLFDHAEIGYELSDNNMAFLSEYGVIAQHTSIATDYKAFEAACWFSKMLSQNMPYGDDGRGEVFEIAITAFAAWNSQKLPQVVLLKSLYLLMKSEGYPVKQEWIESLAKQDRKSTAYILNTPIIDIDIDIDGINIEKIIVSLRHWIKHHAHFVC